MSYSIQPYGFRRNGTDLYGIPRRRYRRHHGCCFGCLLFIGLAMFAVVAFLALVIFVAAHGG